jgi:probable phosphoglycerate mutase
MRHAQVAYFEETGRPVPPERVTITREGEEQARAAAAALAGVRFDRVITSGLERTLATARIVAPGREAEIWPELRELRGGRLHEIPEDEIEAAFTAAFRGDVPLESRFLGGDTVGSLVDRVVPAIERLVAEPVWDCTLAVLHGGVNRAILSYALTGTRRFLGSFEQAPACINILDVGDDWIVRTVNYAAYDPGHGGPRWTTMEELYEQYLPYRRGGRLP